MKIKLIVCDIDNTLVIKHQELSERAAAAIARLKEKGVYFGLASGRSVEQLQQMIDRWNIHCDLLIGYNGSEIYDGLKDEVREIYRMEPQWLKQCIEIMSPFKANPGLGRDGRYYVRYLDEAIRASAKFAKDSTPPYVVKDDSEFWAEPAIKIGFRVSAEDMPAIEAHAAPYNNENFIGFKTENTMFEFCNANASKGKILRSFCEEHGIDLEAVWAFGDMTNDISMLEAAGVGVCMLNGSQDAKDAAQYITEKGVDEDGWADFVENHILTQLD